MFTASDLSSWITLALPGSDPDPSFAGWRVSHVLVTEESAIAFGLVLGDPPEPLILAGTEVRWGLLPAVSRDVCVELVPVDGERNQGRLHYMHLTLGLEKATASAYGSLRDNGYTPVDALRAAHAVLA